MPTENRRNTAGHFGANLFVGTVVSTDPATMVVEVVPDGQQNLNKLQGIPLAATFAHALGFKETVLPTVSSRVLCFGGYSGYCIIIGVIPPMDFQSPQDVDAGMPSKVIIGAGEPVTESVHSSGYYADITKSIVLNNQLPTDVVQGEKVIANEFGVLLGLFQTFAALKGSELAQVQTHFLDDLVRIISHNFQHYHALGEHNIFHDGKGLHLEVGLTHDPKEALGVPQIYEQESPRPSITEDGKSTPDDKQDYYKIEDERLKAIERLKIFLGKLGDFVNILLVAPSDELRSQDGRAIETPDRGLFQAHLSLDGMLTVRTVKGLVLEKTNWIRVPHRTRSPEDPEGDDATGINYPLREAYEFDETYLQDGKPFLYYLQLKDYLSYLDTQRLSTFKTHEKDFSVNDDYKKERPLESITFVDPITHTAFKRTRSLITLMPNGGIAMTDAWSSGIVMEGGNIYIQPANDLVLQPMRNIIAKVGGHVSVAAKKDIGLSSTTGGFRIKTDKAQYLYSANSGIALHSDGPYIEDGLSPLPDELEAAQFISGIVLKAPQSGVQFFADQVYTRAERAVIEATHAVIEAEDNLHLMSDGNLFLSTHRGFFGAKQVLQMFSQGSVTLLGDTGTTVGKKDQTFGIAKAGKIIAPVEGLIDTVDKNKNFYDALMRIVNDLDEFEANEFVAGFKEEEDFENLKFLFPSSDYYQLADSDIIPQTLVQLEDSIFPGLHRLEKWIEEPVNDTYPYPGKDKALSFVQADLKNIEKTDENDLINKVKDLTGLNTLKDPSDIFQAYTARI